MKEILNCGPWEDSFDVKHNRNLSAKMDSPWSTEDPNFMNNTNLAPTCWQGVLAYHVYHQEEPQTEDSCTMPCLFTCLNWPLQGSPGFIFLPVDWDLPCPFRTTQIISSFVSIPTNQNCTTWTAQFGNLRCIKLGTWMGIFSIKDGLPFALVENNLGCYLNLSPGLQLLLLK